MFTVIPTRCCWRPVFNIINSHANIYHQTPGSSVPINIKSDQSSDRLGQVTKGSVHTSHVKAQIKHSNHRDKDQTIRIFNMPRSTPFARNITQDINTNPGLLGPVVIGSPFLAPDSTYNIRGSIQWRRVRMYKPQGCRQDSINKTKRAH